MDSHTFGPPQLLVVDDTNIYMDAPTWSIDILRRNIVVGTLHVNKTNLPPRKNKKKILWKLPDDPSMVPKFGVHEQKRLWELFKEQKKLRRKTLKQQKSGDALKEEVEEVGSSPQTKKQNGDNETANGVANGSSHIDNNNNKEKKNATDEPPPVRAASCPSTETKIGTSNGPTTNHSNPLPPPPPPGLLSSSPLPDEPAQVPSSMTPSTTPPPGLSVSPPLTPAPPPGFVVSTAPRSVFDLDQNPNAVVEAFLTTVCQSQLDAWLSYYKDDATKTVLIGSAQAVSQTPQERKEHWAKLQPQFQLSGCTCIRNHPHLGQHPGSSALVVLTGTTRQQLGDFSFTLSLWLVSVAGSGGGYQIQNDVLTLFALPHTTTSMDR